MWRRLAIVSDEPPAGDLPRAAVLAPLFDDEAGRMRVVLTKRPDTMPTHAGHIAFPGGRPDAGDRGPVDTALREAEEEVGIRPGQVEVLGFLPPIHTVEYSLLVVPVVGRIREVPELRPSPREVAAVFTPPADELADPARWRYEIWNGRRVWFYDLEGEVLWGATAAMVRGLFGLEV